MHRFLPLLVLVVVLLGAYLYLPIRRQVFYSLHISGDFTQACCNVADIEKSDGSFDELSSTAIFNSEIIDYPKTSLAEMINPPQLAEANPNVLGTTNSNGEQKWIEISLDQQMLRAWEGNKIVMEYPISSGKWFPTPKGDFTIWYKTRSQRMKGGSKELGTYYDLPNVPYNMFFYQGYGIHGAYWHNNFGHPMSHGCVNEPLNYAKVLFDWAGPVLPPGVGAVRATPDNPGTRVFIH